MARVQRPYTLCRRAFPPPISIDELEEIEEGFTIEEIDLIDEIYLIIFFGSKGELTHLST